MTVPLDRLYHFIETLAEQDHKQRVVIYRFFPHGSKRLADWSNLRDYDCKTFLLNAKIFCADQEPLDYDYYEQRTGPHDPDLLEIIMAKNQSQFQEFFCTNLKYPFGNIMYRRPVLLHSEQRSHNVERYQSDAYIPAYYWSHAIIALDWFRFAQHVEQTKSVTHTFLIYNRAWAGTREYRLKFLELLAQRNLQAHCQTSVNPVEPELNIRYDQHKFDNQVWQPNMILEDHFPASTAHSHYSADFDIEDYESTDIEVVLETLFDDARWHLTEKSLRPMACAQPFVLAATPGSLEYLRSYGFQTFADVWDESYDQETDPVNRLTAIADLMREIADWSPEIKQAKMAQARAIAEHNREHFFSEQFFDQVVGELKRNLSAALDQSKTIRTQDIKCLIEFFEKLFALEEVQQLVEHKQYDDIEIYQTALQELKQQYQQLTGSTGTTNI
jgi:hypothetical protein